MGGSSEKKPGIWKAPLLHFFVLGLVVFGLRAWLERPPPDGPDPFLIEITSNDLDWFRTMWKKRSGREPTLEELRGHVNRLIREQVLAREARALGMDRNDDVVRRRLAQKMDFLFRDMAAGLQTDDETLRAYLETHRNRYEIPGEISFEQVFFKTDERGVAGAELAVAMFLDHPNRPGDATMLPRDHERMSAVQVRGLFGADFAEALQALPIGDWQGPVPSSYGLHAVRVTERTPSRMPALEDIRATVLADWLSEQQGKASSDAYMDIRETYRVLVEGMPYTQDLY